MNLIVIFIFYILLNQSFKVAVYAIEFVSNGNSYNERHDSIVNTQRIEKDPLYLKLNSGDFKNNTEYSNSNVRKIKQIENSKVSFEWMTERERALKSYSSKLHYNDKNDLKSQYNLICSSIKSEVVFNKRFWTHLIFIHADNNLESMSLVDLAEMTSPLHSNTAEYLHLVVYIDRCIDYTDKEISTPIVSCPESGLTNPKIKQEDISQNFTGAYILYRWHLTGELKIKFKKKFVWILLDDLGEVDSNSPLILSNFISKGLNMFPSVYTALTLWNHGSAWTGFGDDHDNADGVGMFLGDMYKGIKEGIMNSVRGGNKGKNFSFEFKFDVLGFDACLMMQFDVLESMSSLASYILASEDNEPGHGWNFRSINPVTKRSSTEDEVELLENGKVTEYRIATPLEYASRIVYGYSLHSQSYPLTLSVINTELFQVFKYNLYNLFTMLYTCGGELIGDTIKKSILNSRKIENCDLVNLCSCFDMGDMLEQLRKYLSKEFNIDESIHELLALTLDSYYNMQVASVNLQDDENLNENKSLDSRLTGISIYFPDINQQVTCRISSTAKILSKKYTKQNVSKWSHIINDVIINKPGRSCNLNVMMNSKEMYNGVVGINKTIVDYNENIMELSLTSRMDNQVLLSQTIISYPVNDNIGKLVPVSLIFPTRIDSNGLTYIQYKPNSYEILQKSNSTEINDEFIKSNITLISGIERDHYTAHFVFYEKKEEIDTDKGNIAYLIFYNNTSKILYLSASEGMVERKKIESGYLVPVIYYVRVDPKKNSYFDEFYYQLQVLYEKFSDYLNSYTFPTVGINILPRYDDVIIKSRRIQLVTSIKKNKIFYWGEFFNREFEIKLVKKKNEKYKNSRILLNRYSETINGYDELVTLGISTNNIKLNNICKDEWIEDGICDLFCENDLKDCENIIERVNNYNSTIKDKESNQIIPDYIENHSIHVTCNHQKNISCWKYSSCAKANNGKTNFCICNEGFRHQIIRIVDSITGKILFRHSCEDIDECNEHSRQFKTEEREQKEGDIYMGYNTNHAIYPSIERTREVISILNSPFSSIKKHIITPEGLKRPCHPFAICLNKVGGYECKCKPGYYGDGKKFCIQENICEDKIKTNDNKMEHILFQELLRSIGIDNNLINDTNYCPVGLHCINKGLMDEYDHDLIKSYYCGCKKGFELSKKKMKCIDVDECKEKKEHSLNSCSYESICTNTFGSYLCSCPLGWLGNGHICVPKEEMRDIAIEIQLNGLYEGFISLSYENFLILLKQSIIQVLNIQKDGIEIANITVNQEKSMMNIVIHFKKDMKTKRRIYKNLDSSPKEETSKHVNLEKAILFIEELKNNTSNWYKSTYIGINYGNMINPSNIKASTIYRKDDNLISKLLINYTTENIYLFLNSSPYGRPITILSLLTIISWSTILITLILISTINLSKFIRNKKFKTSKDKIKKEMNIELQFNN